MTQLTLRPYQQDVLEKLREGFRAGHRVQLLYGATGFGKTECAIALLKATHDKGNRGAMILDRIVLCDQTSARLQKYSLDHGVMQAGHWRYRPYERIQVCSAQTLEKRGSFPGLNVLIVDECHDQRKATTEFIKNNPDVKVIGLSATPFSDGLSGVYTNVVTAATTAKLVEWKNLVPLEVFICKEVDMTGAKKVAGEWSVDVAAERGAKITGDIVAEWSAKTQEVFGGPVKTIVFASSVDHGANLSKKFAEAGYNFVAISYQDSDEYKAEVMKDFARPDTEIHGLIACSLLTKGYDEPSVRCGISARPYSKSFKSHVQEMGRVMRPMPVDLAACAAHKPGEPEPSLVKPFALWLDFSGNYLRFKEDWDELYHEGVRELKDGREKPKSEKTPKEKEQAKCPKCKALWAGKSRVCRHCGYERPFHNIVEEVAGTLEKLDDAVTSKNVKQQWYSELLTIAQDRGYSSGWVSHKYKEKFGVWPKNMRDEPADKVSAEVARWEKSRRIAFAKGKAKATA